MTIVTGKPMLRPRALDHWMNDLFPAERAASGSLRAFEPAINLIEKENGWRFEIAAPGLQKEDFQVEVEDHLLRIQLEKKNARKEGESVLREEFGAYRLERNYRLSERVDEEKINARYEAGILIIDLPKSEKARPRRIKVG